MIGRPQEVEAAPYYFTYINQTYINQVTGDDVIAILERQSLGISRTTSRSCANDISKGSGNSGLRHSF